MARNAGDSGTRGSIWRDAAVVLAGLPRTDRADGRRCRRLPCGDRRQGPPLDPTSAEQPVLPVRPRSRFAAANWFRGESGAPPLEGAVVSFDCRVARITDVGSHSVLFCEVVGVADGTLASGLFYFDRAYRRIGDLLV